MFAKIPISSAVAAAALAFAVVPASADRPAADGSGPLPGDTPIPFWPHETGVNVGTSETFTDLRADGSYHDPSLGRRVTSPALALAVARLAH
jgi:hypothetical protein